MEKGFIYDSSIFPTRLSRYGISDSPKEPYIIKKSGGNTLVEIPLSTHRVAGWDLPFAGGGYMRLYPYAITKHLITQINKQGKPIVAYFHPYEIDPDEFQKMNVKIPFKLRIIQGLNRKKIKDRFKALLEDFEFVPIKVYLQSYKLSAS